MAIASSHDAADINISSLYFPLISVLVPKWLGALSRKTSSGAPSKKVLFLISGASVPEDEEHPAGSGSTEGTAVLMLRFLRAAYPDVLCIHLPSGAEVFRYDATVGFLRSALVPRIEDYRKALVAAHMDRWSKHFSLCISMAAGAPARLAALNAILRSHRPSYLHINQTKGFYFSGDIGACMRHVVPLDFETVEGTPAVPAEELDDELRGVVTEMRRYAAHFLKAVRGVPDFTMTPHPKQSRGQLGTGAPTPGDGLGAAGVDGGADATPAGGPEGRTRRRRSRSRSNSSTASGSSRGAKPRASLKFAPSAAAQHTPGAPLFLQPVRASSFEELESNGPSSSSSAGAGPDHELASFWIRKTRAPVLALLCVRKPGGKPAYYRSMNLEVSMPTGSLCAERGAIAQALAADPGLQRRDIRAVAVLSLPKLDHPDARVQAAYEQAGVAPASGFYSGRVAQPQPLAQAVGFPVSSFGELPSSATGHASSAAAAGRSLGLASAFTAAGASGAPAVAAGTAAPPVPQGTSSSSSSHGEGDGADVQSNGPSGAATRVLPPATVLPSSLPPNEDSRDIDAILMPPPPPAQPYRERERAASRSRSVSDVVSVGSAAEGSGGGPGGPGGKTPTTLASAAPPKSSIGAPKPGSAHFSHPFSASGGSGATTPMSASALRRAGTSSPGIVMLASSGSSAEGIAGGSPQQANSSHLPAAMLPPAPARLSSHDGDAMGLADGASSVCSTGSASSLNDNMMAAATVPAVTSGHPLASYRGTVGPASLLALAASSYLPRSVSPALDGIGMEPPAKRSKRDRDWGGSESGTGTPVRLGGVAAGEDGVHALNDGFPTSLYPPQQHHHQHQHQPVLLFESRGSGAGGGDAASSSAGGAGAQATPGAGTFIVTSAGVGPHMHLAPSPVHVAPPSGPPVPTASNPLLPCGACTEWLKKIEDVNPAFAVLTFADIACDRVYVQRVPDL